MEKLACTIEWFILSQIFHNFINIVCLVCNDAESKQVLRTIKTLLDLSISYRFHADYVSRLS